MCTTPASTPVKKYIHIDLTNEPDLSFVEAGVAGPLDTVADVDALYTQLLDAGMTEAFDGFLVDPSDLSSIQDRQRSQISFDFAGHSALTSSDATPDAARNRAGQGCKPNLELSPSLILLER